MSTNILDQDFMNTATVTVRLNHLAAHWVAFSLLPSRTSSPTLTQTLGALIQTHFPVQGQPPRLALRR
ncbi:unnamed protein product [Strongylus vulgaris]|uniref:Uncharacterized protein n=1 Tax=Strongylus vulgaris TaxID=40348 RepID=A0A3P7IDS3_STRVU|nr:unnamed protein product [Strongylus vulgaris]